MNRALRSSVVTFSPPPPPLEASPPPVLLDTLSDMIKAIDKVAETLEYVLKKQVIMDEALDRIQVAPEPEPEPKDEPSEPVPSRTLHHLLITIPLLCLTIVYL